MRKVDLKYRLFSGLQKLLPLLIVFMLALSATAQYQGRRKVEPYPKSPQQKMGGLYFSPGISYTLVQPGKSKFEEQLDSNDLRATLETIGKAKVRAYADIGWFHFFKYPRFFRFWDAGIAYKWLQGEEQYTLGYDSAGTVIGSPINRTNSFNHHTVTGHFNLSNTVTLKNGNFLVNTFGINVDYAVLQNNNIANYEVPAFGTRTPAQLMAQVHYKFGYGWKANDKWLVIPMIEIPLITGFPFGKPEVVFPLHSTAFRPLFFSIRFMRVRPYKEFCPPVKSVDLPGGKGIGTDMERRK